MSQPTHGDEMHQTDTAPGDERAAHGELAQGAISYVVGITLATVLTILSFAVAQTHLVWTPSIPVALFVLAVAQMGVHIVFFLHITSGPDSTNNVMALAFGVLIVTLVIGGSIWIMSHLEATMPPLGRIMQMQR